MQNDRLTLDGANRGADDPDNRRQQQMLVPQQGIPYLDEGTRHAQREIQERWQDAQRAHGIEPQPAMDRASSQTQRSADGLAAQVEALRQRLQGQQQSQQQSRSRGQGMGW